MALAVLCSEVYVASSMLYAAAREPILQLFSFDEWLIAVRSAAQLVRHPSIWKSEVTISRGVHFFARLRRITAPW